MPFLKIWVHAVWTTKKRKPLLRQEHRQAIFDHMYENALDKDILIDRLGGHVDHIHCLFRLKNDQTISKVMQLLKGEAAYWANKNLQLKEKLQWQSEYYAVSVSESGVQNVRKYIEGQEEHHAKSSFLEEYDSFIQEYGFNVFQ